MLIELRPVRHEGAVEVAWLVTYSFEYGAYTTPWKVLLPPLRFTPPEPAT